MMQFFAPDNVFYEGHFRVGGVRGVRGDRQERRALPRVAVQLGMDSSAESNAFGYIMRQLLAVIGLGTRLPNP
jgi:hypothetical protein